MARSRMTKNHIYHEHETWSTAFYKTLANDLLTGDLDQDATPRRIKTAEIPLFPEDWDSYSYWEAMFDQEFEGYPLSCMCATVLRRFFITEMGRMGIGPSSTKPGDDIVLICGAGSVPFCVRKEPDWTEDNQIYTHVGDVYLHGVMYGEAMPENWEEKVIQIHLR
ncbi:hypothetical protein M011DRAFT_485352 [Sporormia fimetaria CBS 119925]|uniref:Heterokaryon incompatibility domain-containing protein n=1 Tax=Sporormia fimetaria CBS 119925 TaxID=1340428 RepID=A0A6A6VDM4_9PLEO|nr:hypothetical protein M011DRAFT_485352 [Sporormia fimetaria CBS 119925]